ncbi:family 16 glycosylhydrolase [Tamlana sp. s12]|uniref:family 16 glycosylhydrolase n=1 Tax=Tamlana sp. s12 TaxID=1630406 RepID=UPI0008399D8C|nr:family 16 glycosylhydrolase [Tamlana sp. s12]QQY82314.1 family 16 glycosylhydrolase [Tamlana sp. s12]
MKNSNFYQKHRKFFLSATSFLLLTIVAYAQRPTKTENPADQWTIKWNASDEFNNSTPDWAKWIKTGNLPNTTAWKWDNHQNVKISNDGVAALTMRQNPNNASDGGTYFKSGILKSYNTFTYGYFEAKIKGAHIGEGVCPSFWLYSNFDYTVGEGQTVYSEIDIVELQQFDWYEGHQDDVRDIDLNLHAVVKQNGQGVWRRPKMHPDEQLNKWRASWDPTQDFHIYGCEVNEQEIIWYIDGVEVARKPNTYWHRPMNVTLSLGLRKPFVEFYNNRNNAVNPESSAATREKLKGIPTTMYVDYVRVWEKSGTSVTPPSTSVGVIENNGFETGSLSSWNASAGASEVLRNNASSGQHAGYVNNSSIAQLVTLKANTTYKVTAKGKAANSGVSTFLGISESSSNTLIGNYEFDSTSYSTGEVSVTTGNSDTVYRIWYWSSGQGYCDDFTLEEVDGDTSQPVAVTGVSLNKTSVTLEEGNSTTLSANVSPQNATNKNVTWQVSNSQVLSVNNGQITALKAGNASVTVTTQDGNHVASCYITVTEATGDGSGDDGSSNTEVPQSGQTISLKSSEGLFLTVNTGAQTAIQATQNNVNSKEQFVVVTEGNFIGLQSVSTNKYVTTASDNTIKCGASGVFNRQQFTFESNGSGGFYIKSKINGLYWKLDRNSSAKGISATVSKNQASIFNWDVVGVTNKQQTLKTSNDESLAADKINVYPNPYSNGELTIKLAKAYTGSIEFKNINGQNVLRLHVNNQNHINISNSELRLPSGLYFISLNIEGNSVVKKWLVN